MTFDRFDRLVRQRRSLTHLTLSRHVEMMTHSTHVGMMEHITALCVKICPCCKPAGEDEEGEKEGKDAANDAAEVDKNNLIHTRITELQVSPYLPPSLASSFPPFIPPFLPLSLLHSLQAPSSKGWVRMRYRGSYMYACVWERDRDRVCVYIYRRRECMQGDIVDS